MLPHVQAPFRWKVYGADPVTGEPWTFDSTQGPPSHVPRVGTVRIWQPGVEYAQKHALANGTWYWYWTRADCWMESQEDGSALAYFELLIDEVEALRRGWYELKQYFKDAVNAQFEEDLKTYG